MLVGALKAQSLYRVRLADNKAIHQETLISDLARVRDIEMALDGSVYLLLENNQGGLIVRLRPAAPAQVAVH